MFGLDMIDAFIGLIFVYLTLSLIVTAFGNSVSQSRNFRGDTLKTAIDKLVGKSLSDEVYGSHLVQALKTPASKRQAKKAAKGSQRAGHLRHPSYIPDRVFCESLLECLLGQNPRGLRNDPAQFGAKLTRGLDNAGEHCRTTLEAFWQAANHDIDAFEASVCQWFNDATDRLTGAFKRRINKTLLIWGLGVAAALNANSITIYKNLTDNPQLREEYLKKAVDLAQNEDATSLEALCDGLIAKTSDSSTSAANAEASDSAEVCTPANIAKHQALAVMPLIGWTRNSPPLASLEGARFENLGHLVSWAFLWSFLYAILGWALTAGALSLGAPFWFDLLQKFVKIRGSLQPAPSTDAAPGQPAGTPAAPGGAAPAALDLEDFSSFERKKLAYSPINALWLARFAELSYHDSKEVVVRLQDWGVSGSLHQGAKGTEYLTVETPKLTVLAFRGTEPDQLADIYTDAQAASRQPSWADQGGVEVHTGFHDALDASWDGIISALQATLTDKRQLWLCGHSLGGALAVLTTHRLATEFNATPQLAALYTYGQPRCGNQAFATAVEAALGNRHFRSVNNRDVVPMVPPPELMPYRHSGQVAYFNEFGDFVLNPPLWYRALDKVELEKDAWRSKLREFGSDHAMTGYVKLHRATLG